MAKLTRNSYKRKVILFGVLIFISIALISTGFAAWVMSTNSKKDVDQGNISVGTVTDSSLTFNEVLISNKDIYFEPAADDYSGRVRLGSGEGVHAESLKTTVTGNVTPKAYLGQLKVYLVVTEGVYNALTGTSNYITLETADGAKMSTEDLQKLLVKGTMNSEGKIEYSSAALEGKGLILYTSGSEPVFSNANYSVNTSDPDKVSFTINVNFGWGSTFGNVNPSKYYDEVEAGKAISDNMVKKTLEDFRAELYGYKAALDGAENRDEVITAHAGDKLQFQVVLSATAN
ncbi:MAG: hypothetical protein ACI32E_07070 [Bacilli bacterium]